MKIKNKATNLKNKTVPVEQPTFLEHIQELRGRLFWVALFFVLFSGLAYPFKDQLIALLLGPLGNQQLYYLTPIGGFSFIIKICSYVGILLTLPVAVYHLYKYIQPVVGKVKQSVLAGYTFFSVILAAAGVAFAYFISLPAALHFLTNFDIQRVTAMLTVDSYLSFVISYLLGAALLFQLPLLLLIINSITPLPPKKLMGYQRHVILAAFVIAAIISPTTDVTNQALMAVPIIFMYQFGIISVATRNAIIKKPAKPMPEVVPVIQTPVAAPVTENIPSPVITPAPEKVPEPVAPILHVAPVPKPVQSVDGFMRKATTAPLPSLEKKRPLPQITPLPGGRALDGFMIARPS